MSRYYDQDILNALRTSDRPLLMREVIERVAPDDFSAYSAIGNSLTDLYRNGRVAREKPGRWYAYTYVPEYLNQERVILEIDRQLWSSFQAACERRGYTTSQIVEQVVREQMEAWSLSYEDA